MTNDVDPVAANLHHELISPRSRADAYPTLVLLHGRGDSAAGICRWPMSSSGTICW